MRPLATWLAVVLLAYPFLAVLPFDGAVPRHSSRHRWTTRGCRMQSRNCARNNLFHDGVGWCRQDLRQLLPALLFTLGQVMLVLQATWMFRCPFPFGPPF